MRVGLNSPYGGLFSTQTTRLYCKVQSSYLDLNNIVKAKVYPNADKNKSEILEDNKRKTGIYIWVNTINGKIYIGSGLNLRDRFISYYNMKHLQDNTNMVICRALIKYGYSSFRLEIF